jgi:NAD(P)-dependent dehydrogenase (short-subunit alcohol dehydrogenase family)
MCAAPRPSILIGMHDEELRPEGTTRRSMLAGAAAGAGAIAALGPLSPSRAEARGRARRFEGKVVIITGATSGIGEATARAFAAEGARVSFCGRRTALGRQVEQEIRAAGGDASYIAADVREPDSVERFVERTVRRYGRLDIAFNNAGIQTTALLHDAGVEAWDDSMNTNARGVFLAMKHQIPHMLRSGGGTIIVNSSIGAIVGRPNLPVYQATKRAILALVQSAALAYGEQGIRVNAILPGIVDTAMIRPPGFDDATWEQALVALGALNVDGFKRVAEPPEIANAVLALASDGLSYMTGASVPVDGGIVAGRPLQLPEG